MDYSIQNEHSAAAANMRGKRPEWTKSILAREFMQTARARTMEDKSRVYPASPQRDSPAKSASRRILTGLGYRLSTIT